MKYRLIIPIILFVVLSSACFAEILNFSLEDKNIFQFIDETRIEVVEIVSNLLDLVFKKKKGTDEAVLKLSEKMDFTVMWHVLEMVQDSHIKKDSLDYEKLIIGATNGMLQAIDPYSRLEAGENFKELWSMRQGGLSGIGAIFKKKGRYIMIESTMKGSPALLCGLQKGDIVEMVDGDSIRNLKIENVISLIRGKSGTSVRLRIFRKGGLLEKFDVVIERAPIILDTVSHEFKQDEGKLLAVIKIKSFDPDTINQFIEAGDIIEQANPDGIIIDLRDNPGGNLDVVSKICSVMCGRGKTLLIMDYANGVKNKITSDSCLSLSWKRERAFYGTPIVCLVNKMSASASELMTACLRENLGIKIIGEKTYGKGVGQEVQMTPEGILLLTTFRWLTPQGNSIDGMGITPDFEVEMDEESVNNKTDPQMEKAVEVLKRYFDVKDFRKGFFVE